MMDFGELYEQAVRMAAAEPGRTVYIWVNQEGEKDSWAIDTDKDSLVEEPIFFFKRGAAPSPYLTPNDSR